MILQAGPKLLFRLACRLGLLALAVTASDAMPLHTFYASAAPRGSAGAGLYRGQLDLATGALAPLVQVAAVEGANFLAISRDGRRVFASVGSAGVAAFSVEPDGTLALRSQASTGGRAVHVWLEPREEFLLAANFDEGTVVAFRLGADGTSLARSGSLQFSGSGPRLPRQEKSRPHAVYTSATGRWVFVCDLGADRIWVAELERTSGKLISQPGREGAVEPGAGPRHAALHPSGRFLYVNTEMTPRLATFAVDPDTGALAFRRAQPVLPDSAGSPNANTAENFFHPGGRALYISTRGQNGLSAYRIAENGEADWLGHVEVPVRGARTFAITPDGRWMIVAGEGGGEVATLQLDETTLRPRVTPHLTRLPGVNCVMFVP